MLKCPPADNTFFSAQQTVPARSCIHCSMLPCKAIGCQAPQILKLCHAPLSLDLVIRRARPSNYGGWVRPAVVTATMEGGFGQRLSPQRSRHAECKMQGYKHNLWAPPAGLPARGGAAWNPAAARATGGSLLMPCSRFLLGLPANLPRGRCLKHVHR